MKYTADSVFQTTWLLRYVFNSLVLQEVKDWLLTARILWKGNSSFRTSLQTMKAFAIMLRAESKRVRLLALIIKKIIMSLGNGTENALEILAQNTSVSKV